MSETPPVPEDDEIDQIEGPPPWPHAGVVLVRTLVIFVPIAALVTGVAGFARLRGGMAPDDFDGLAIGTGCILAFLSVFIPWIGTSQAKLLRNQRTSWLLTRYPPRSRKNALAWSCTLAKRRTYYQGSFHLLDGKIRFVAHWPVGGTFVLTNDPLLDLEPEQVRAIELHPAASAREWFSLGSPLVVLLLRDGRQVRLATAAPDRFARHLRELLGRAEATPLGPPLELDAATPREIAAVLASKHPTVALVLLEADAKKPPLVVLHGNNEALRGALELARDALAKERDALAPYLAGREAPPTA